MNQAAGADDFFNTTIIEGLTDDVCPVSKTLGSSSAQSLLRILVSIAAVGYSCSKVTGNRSRKASLSTLVPMNRPSSLPLPLVFAVAMTLNPLAGSTHRPIFLRKTLSLQGCSGDREFVTSEVDLIKEQDSFLVEANDCTIVPDGFTINKAETANKIIFIGFDCNVYTDEFSSELSTCLFDRERFTIARETRDKRG